MEKNLKCSGNQGSDLDLMALPNLKHVIKTQTADRVRDKIIAAVEGRDRQTGL